MRIVCQKCEGSVWRCLLIFFLQYLSHLNILGTIASHEMVENIKTTKTRGLERMDEFISRFTDFEKTKEPVTTTAYKKKRLYHFKLSKRKPRLQFLLMKVSHSVKFSPVLKVKNWTFVWLWTTNLSFVGKKCFFIYPWPSRRQRTYRFW